MSKNKKESQEQQIDGRVVKIVGEVFTIEAAHDDVAFIKNEVVYVIPSQEGHREERLKAEILRVRGREADIQVFEETRGIAIGDIVQKSGELLALDLGPGMLGQVYDGLQNPARG